MHINLISDTVTKPTPGMLHAMMTAEVGDDVFREDPTVRALEEKCAALLGHEAALFCPSGTMTNQIALRLHTRPMDEVICDELSHIYQYENGGYALNAGVAIQLLPGQNGILNAEQVEKAVRPRLDWLPASKLVVLENTCNKGGGSVYSLENIQSIKEVCRRHRLALHLDGARLFNALVETGDSPAEVGKLFDTVTIALSKGLGAPVGSVLAGSSALIAEARRLRKAFGGGMRQAGFLAAAGIYALDHNIERLRDDHRHARLLADTLAELPWADNIRPVQTNILIFDLLPPLLPTVFLDYLEKHGIRATAFGPQTIRFVTHLDVQEGMIKKVIQTLRNMKL